jgi:hypothetical protein
LPPPVSPRRLHSPPQVPRRHQFCVMRLAARDVLVYKRSPYPMRLKP